MRALLTSLLFLSLLEAKIVITPTVGKQITKPSAELKDDEVLMGVGIQAYINDNFAVDMRVESSDSNLMADGGRTDIERGSVNLLYDFTPKKVVSPYLLGGLGYEKLHRTYLDIKSQSFAQAGGGLKVKMTDTLEFVTEAKYIKKLDTKDSEVVATCGIGVKFGTDECEISCDALAKLPKADHTTTLTTPKVSQLKTADTKQKATYTAKPAVKPVGNTKLKNGSVVFSDEVIASQHLLKRKNDTSKYKYTKKTTLSKGNYIQVAALTQKTNLIKTVKKLKTRGLKVKTLKKGATTVVLVGPYSKNTISKVYQTVKSFQKDAFYKKL